MLDTAGSFLSEYIAPTDDYTGSFNQPRGVMADPRGSIVVADTGNRRVVTLRDVLPSFKSYLPLIVRAGR